MRYLPKNQNSENTSTYIRPYQRIAMGPRRIGDGIKLRMMSMVIGFVCDRMLGLYVNHYLTHFGGTYMAYNCRSKLITAGIPRSPNRAMLRAVGFDDKDFDKPHRRHRQRPLHDESV